MTDKDTPLRLVRREPKWFPGIWEALDACREAKAEGEMDWPDYCHLPIGAAHTALVDMYGLSNEQAAQLCAELTACYTWRQSRVIYNFDPDLAEALAAQAESMEDTDVLPVELLLHLPYSCIYIKAPGVLDEHLDGCFVWIEHDINREAPELRVQCVLDGYEYSVPLVLHLVSGTILDCIQDTNTEIAKHTDNPEMQASGVEDIRMLLTAIQLLLYLVSDNAEVEETPRLARKRGNGAPSRSQDEDKMSNVQANDVGFRIGSAIRASRYASHKGTGKAKRPHSRRGHWHHYWAGAQGTPERRLILKWTAPTFVHGVNGEEITVYPVK